MEHESEYHDAMITILELIWGDGFMAPGGEGHVANLIDGLDVRNKSILDFGCGLGGPAFVLAETYGATVVGIDIEADLIDRAQHRAKELGLDAQTDFQVVEPGPLVFPNEAFDVVLSSGAFTQIDNKREMYEECRRVLRPGGVLTCYDWMKSEGEYSVDMRYWFKMEGLTYAMETPKRHEEILEGAGFTDIEIKDRSDWYRRRAQDEYEQIRSELYPRMVELMGQRHADHFVENWRAMVVVCKKGEMLQVYCRARKPT
jgi:phosphoethanolamine N-methyltransferase